MPRGHTVFQNRAIRFAPIAALALSAGACGEDPASPSDAGRTVEAYVASVTAEDTPGTLQTSAIPHPTAEGPAISVSGNSTIVNGGTASLSVTSSTPFTTVYLAGSGPISRLFMSVTGFFEIPLPQAMTAAAVVITFPQALPSSDFALYVSVADQSGHVGSVVEQPFHALFVGTGDVQVTASWDADSDVDLHVVDPSGQEVFWGNRQSSSGGQLDLDSNAACTIDGVRNENITWAVGTAPQGTYTVRLDYWDSCGVPQTNYTVLIHSDGQSQIYHGTFFGAGDHGSLGSGTLIDTFTRTTGTQPSLIAAPAPRAYPTRK